MDAPTQLDLFEAGKREALISPTRFDAAIIDTEGSDVNILINVSASMAEEVVAYVQSRYNALFLSTATGDDLDRLVYDRFQIVRHSAHSAVATLTLTRSDTAAGATVPSGSTFTTATGIAFSTINDVVFPSGSGGPLTVSAIAVNTGAQGNVGVGTITVVADAGGVDGVSVTNTETAAGGQEAETDDELRDRARNFFFDARRGTRSALESGATATAGVVFAKAEEILDSEGQPSGFVELFIADVNGQANEALADSVRDSLDEYRALGVPVTVYASNPQYIDIVATGLLFEAGYNTTQVLSNARAAIVSAVNTTEPNQVLRRSTILSALSGIDGLIVPNDALSEPAGDVTPAQGNTIRTTSDRVDLS